MDVMLLSCMYQFSNLTFNIFQKVRKMNERNYLKIKRIILHFYLFNINFTSWCILWKSMVCIVFGWKKFKNNAKSPKEIVDSLRVKTDQISKHTPCHNIFQNITNFISWTIRRTMFSETSNRRFWLDCPIFFLMSLLRLIFFIFETFSFWKRRDEFKKLNERTLWHYRSISKKTMWI